MPSAGTASATRTPADTSAYTSRDLTGLVGALHVLDAVRASEPFHHVGDRRAELRVAGRHGPALDEHLLGGLFLECPVDRLGALNRTLSEALKRS